MCLYGQACYFGQVIHNSLSVGQRAADVCHALRFPEYSLFIYIKHLSMHVRKMEDCKMSPNEKLHVKNTLIWSNTCILY